MACNQQIQELVRWCLELVVSPFLWVNLWSLPAIGAAGCLCATPRLVT